MLQELNTLAVLHASQLVTLAGPKRPRVGAEMSKLAIIRDGGMLIREGKIDKQAGLTRRIFSLTYPVQPAERWLI